MGVLYSLIYDIYVLIYFCFVLMSFPIIFDLGKYVSLLPFCFAGVSWNLFGYRDPTPCPLPQHNSHQLDRYEV